MISIEELLRAAKEHNASDVHITVGVPPKMRINGDIVNMDYPKLLPNDTSSILPACFTCFIYSIPYRNIFIMTLKV